MCSAVFPSYASITLNYRILHIRVRAQIQQVVHHGLVLLQAGVVNRRVLLLVEAVAVFSLEQKP